MPYVEIEDPIISNMERTGYPTGKAPKMPVCPICGEECETIYFDKDWNAFACDMCIRESDAWDVRECFPNGGFDG